MQYRGRTICEQCAKPILIQIKIEESKNDRYGCTCHSCQIAIECGYTKKNNEWVKI